MDSKRTAMVCAFALLAAVSLSGCGGDDDEAPPAPGDTVSTAMVGTGSFTGDIRASVKRVDHARAAAELVGRRGDSLRFDASASSVAGLVPGDVVLFDGIAGGEITEVVAQDDGTTTVVLQDVPLTTFIEDGTLEWDQALPFTPDVVPQVIPGFEDQLRAASVVTGSGGLRTSQARPAQTALAPEFNFSGVLNGFDTAVKIKPRMGKVEFEVNLKRSVRGREVFGAQITGFVDNLRTTSRIDVTSGRTTRSNLELKDLTGEVEIVWAGVNPGAFFPAELFQISIPLAMTFTTAVGPIPVTVKVGVLGRVLAQLSVPDMSSRASIKTSFNGESGFTVTESSVTVAGGRLNSNFELTDESVTAGTVTTALSIGVQLPQIEVGIFASSAKAAFTVDTYATGFFEPGILSSLPPCQSVNVTNRGVASFTLSLLGFVTLLDQQQELWKQEQKWQTEGSRCD